MQNLISGIMGSPSGVVFFLFLMVVVGYVFMKFVADNLWVLVGLAVAVFLFVMNLGMFKDSPVPPGDVGTGLSVIQIAFKAETAYEKCLAGYMNVTPEQNAALYKESQICQQKASQYVGYCVPQVKDKWWIFDKAGHCHDEASERVWTPCAKAALMSYTPDNGNVALTQCAAYRTTSIMKWVSGLFSGLGN